MDDMDGMDKMDNGRYGREAWAACSFVVVKRRIGALMQGRDRFAGGFDGIVVRGHPLTQAKIYPKFGA
jgi:hypothetical protein